jgi:hypothetical protein
LASKIGHETIEVKLERIIPKIYLKELRRGAIDEMLKDHIFNEGYERLPTQVPFCLSI